MIIKFSKETIYGTFSDALHLPDNHTYTDQEIEEMKQQRIDNWINFINSTQIEKSPNETTDDIEAQQIQDSGI